MNRIILLSIKLYNTNGIKFSFDEVDNFQAVNVCHLFFISHRKNEKG